jgi:4-hydroxybenzoate polyprenyltransferase
MPGLVLGCHGMATFAVLGIPPAWNILFFTMAGAVLVYSADRYLPYSPEDGTGGRPVQPVVLIFFLLVSVGLVYFAVQSFQSATLAGVLCLALLSMAYVLPLLPSRRRLKDIPYLKAIVVSTGWALSGVLLPALEAGSAIDSRLLFLFLYRVIYLLPNLILSDWPDRDADRAAGIVTVANRCGGAHRLILFSRALTLACAAILGLGVLRGALPLWFLADPAGLILVLVLVRRRLPEKRRFYRLAVDGLAGWPVVPAVWVLVG